MLTPSIHDPKHPDYKADPELEETEEETEDGAEA